MEPASFGELLDGARRGEGAALAGLWTRHARTVAAFARGRGVEDPDAVTSDVFLAAFGQLDGFTGDEEAFRALLFTIARRRATDDLRRRSRRVPTSSWGQEGDERTSRHPVDSAESTVLAREAVGDLLNLIDRLSPGQRDVILLRLVAELPIESTATVLGKSIGTVKSLQRRGLASLRRALERHDTAPTDGDHSGKVTP